MIRVLGAAALALSCGLSSSGCTSSNAALGNSVGSAVGGDMAKQSGVMGFMGSIVSNAGTYSSELNSSPEAEKERAQLALVDLRKNDMIAENSRIARRLTDLSRRMVANYKGEKPPYEFEVFVTRQPEFNAFTTGGGIIFVDQGLLELADSEGEVVAVIAHETAHVLLKHGAKKRAGNVAARVGATAADKFIPTWQTVNAVTGKEAEKYVLSVPVNSYARDQETDADILALDLMVGVGYDPRQMARMFERLEQKQGSSSSSLNYFFSDHPNDAERIKTVRTKIKENKYNLAGLKKDSRDFKALTAELKSKANKRG